MNCPSNPYQFLLREGRTNPWQNYEVGVSYFLCVSLHFFGGGRGLWSPAWVHSSLPSSPPPAHPPKKNKTKHKTHTKGFMFRCCLESQFVRRKSYLIPYFTSLSSWCYSNHSPLLLRHYLLSGTLFKFFCSPVWCSLNMPPALCDTSTQFCPFNPLCQFLSGQSAKTSCIRLNWRTC